MSKLARQRIRQARKINIEQEQIAYEIGWTATCLVHDVDDCLTAVRTTGRATEEYEEIRTQYQKLRANICQISESTSDTATRVLKIVDNLWKRLDSACQMEHERPDAEELGTPCVDKIDDLFDLIEDHDHGDAAEDDRYDDPYHVGPESKVWHGLDHALSQFANSLHEPLRNRLLLGRWLALAMHEGIGSDIATHSSFHLLQDHLALLRKDHPELDLFGLSDWTTRRGTSSYEASLREWAAQCDDKIAEYLAKKVNEWYKSRPAKTSTVTKPKDLAIAAYQLVKELKHTQSRAAQILHERRLDGRSTQINQGTISKWIADVEAYLGAGYELPESLDDYEKEGGRKKKAVSLDAGLLDARAFEKHRGSRRDDEDDGDLSSAS